MASPLDLMHDIKELDPAHWWPPGPGWLLVVLALLAVAAFIYWLLQQRRLYPLGRWQKDAKQRLNDLKRGITAGNAKRVAGELSELLRRIAVARCGRKHIAALTGDAWLAWLSQNDSSGFDWETHGKPLLVLPYAPNAGNLDAESLRQLIDAAIVWMSGEDPCHV